MNKPNIQNNDCRMLTRMKQKRYYKKQMGRLHDGRNNGWEDYMLEAITVK